jgi:hypothetical protein
LEQWLQQIARETARMSYPGSMSRGQKPIVVGKTKAKLEDYFANEFPLRDLWEKSSQRAKDYDSWHKAQSVALGDYLAREGHLGNSSNDKRVVAAKFLNTFMHQLMKYEPFPPLWERLHLPLDARVFDSLRSSGNPTHESNMSSSIALQQILEIIAGKTAYSISYPAYQSIQKHLWGFIDDLNRRPGVQYSIRSRIELNFLWVQ